MDDYSDEYETGVWSRSLTFCSDGSACLHSRKYEFGSATRACECSQQGNTFKYVAGPAWPGVFGLEQPLEIHRFSQDADPGERWPIARPRDFIPVSEKYSGVLLHYGTATELVIPGLTDSRRWGIYDNGDSVGHRDVASVAADVYATRMLRNQRQIEKNEVIRISRERGMLLEAQRLQESL